MYKKIGILALIISSSLFAEETTKKKDYGVRLNESTITTERYEETPVIETAKNITVITSEEIKKRGYNSVEESLVNVPGLSFTGENLSMRGQVPNMGDKNLVVLVDGIPQNGMDNRGFDLDFIPIEQVEKIEVVPAGGAIMYGGNATSGVINIITKDHENKKYWGNAGVKFGSFNEKKYKLNYGMNITDKISIDTKYINLDRDGYRDYEKKESEFIEFGTKYKLNDGKLGFKYIRNDRESTGSGPLNKKQYDEDRKQNESYKGKLATDKQDKFIFDFNKSLTNSLDFSAVTEYRERKYNYKQPKKNTTPAYKSRIKNSDSFYTNAQLKYNYGEKSNIIIGTDYSQAKVKEDKFSKKNNKIYHSSYTKTDYKAIGGYLLNKYNWDKFIFTQGIRVEKTEFDENENTYNNKGKFTETNKTKDNKTNTNYELAVNYMFDEDTSGYLSYNRIYRTPNLGEYTSWRTDKKTGKVDSRDSQKIDTVEIGLKSLINNIYLSSSLFYIQGDKEIMYDPYRDETINDEKGSYYNLDGKTERIGLELSSEQYFDKLTLRQNLTYLFKHKIVDGPYKGKNIPGISDIVFGLGATYEATPNLIFNIESNYHGKSYLINDYYNRLSKADSYIVTNLSTQYNFNNGISISAGINNLFNEIYSDYIRYSGIKENVIVINYSPSPERTYYVSAEYKF